MYASFKKNAEKRNEPLTNDELAFLAGLPVHQISEFREIFRLVDSNNSGTIDATELQQLMASLHFDDVLVNDKYYSDLISRVHARQKNSDDLEEFSFDDFILSIFDRPQVPYTKNEVRNAFQLLAGKSSSKCPPGYIPYSKLTDAIKTAPDYGSFTTEEILLMTSNPPNGNVDYDEIINLMMGNYVLTTSETKAIGRTKKKRNVII